MAEEEVTNVEIPPEGEEPQQTEPAREAVDDVAASEQPPQTDPMEGAAAVPLTVDLISKSLSLISKTGNGLSHAYTRLEIHGKGITNLDHLEKFPHVRHVDCSDNALVSIHGLAHLEFLLSFDGHSNQIRAIPDVLEKKKYLQTVNLARNSIRDFAIQSWPLATWINLNENQLKTLSVQDFPELTQLEARSNWLESVVKVGNAAKLQKVYLAANEISSLEGLANVGQLQLLHLRNNKIENLDGVSDQWKSLTYLNLRGNKIADLKNIDKLKVLPSLRILTLLENPVDQTENYRLEVLIRLPKLDKLDKDPVTQEERDDALNMKKERDQRELLRQQEAAE